MEFNLTRSDIIDDGGIASFFQQNADQVYFVLTETMGAAGEVLGLTVEGCSSCVKGLDVAGAALAFASGLTDGLSFMKEAKGCQEAVCEYGIFSDDAFGAYKEVVRSIGFVAADLLGVSAFMVAMKVKDFALGSFAMVLEGAFAFAMLINIYDNIVVISEGTTPKGGIEQYEVELIEHRYTKNCYGLVRNLTSLSFSVVSVAGMVFCPAGALALGFASFAASVGEFYEQGLIQSIAVDALLIKIRG